MTRICTRTHRIASQLPNTSHVSSSSTYLPASLALFLVKSDHMSRARMRCLVSATSPPFSSPSPPLSLSFHLPRSSRVDEGPHVEGLLPSWRCLPPRQGRPSALPLLRL